MTKEEKQERDTMQRLPSTITDDNRAMERSCVGVKRPHLLCQPQLVSQVEEDAADSDDGREVSVTVPPSKKRMKYTMYCTSSRIVSIETNQDTEGACESALLSSSPFLLQSSPRKEESTLQPALEWWKQKPRRLVGDSHRHCNPSTSLQDATCFVCSRSFTQDDDPIRPVSCSPKTVIMPENAILAYFAPVEGENRTAQNGDNARIQQHRRQEQVVQPAAALCYFCERSACVECMALCEACQQWYCSFCTTTDYRSTTFRTVCLDCNQQTAEQQRDNDGDQDAMNIG